MTAFSVFKPSSSLMQGIHFIFLFLTLLSFVNGVSQKDIVYKKIEASELSMRVYFPEKIDSQKKYPAIVFFFGGGWISRNIDQFVPQAKYFAKRGIVCFIADYRVRKTHQTTAFASLMDAKSAIRYVRKNAQEFHIDPLKVIAAGGSAGGHLAAATALIEGYNEHTDDLSVNCVPNALMLYNPVIDNGPGGYGFERIGSAYKSFSPIHNIAKDAPPTIMFLGTKDKYIPTETAKYYQTVMEKVGSRCDLYLYEGEKHGFFNYKYFEHYKKTLIQADMFLQSLGYLDNEPIVKIE